MNQREAEALDRHITGNYGEDQYTSREDVVFDFEDFIEFAEGNGYTITTIGDTVYVTIADMVILSGYKE